jgi:hypothetical protein
MIIQGSNNPITLTFDSDLTDIPTLVATLWLGRGIMLKRWDKSDMSIDGEVVTLPLTEEETAQMGGGTIVLDVKGLDEDGYTIFWEEASLRVLPRRDHGITLTYTPNN